MMGLQRGWGHMGGGFGPGGMMSGGNLWMGIAGMVIQLLFFGVLIFLAFRLYKSLRLNNQCSPQGTDSALNILKERYAKGEIDTEEFNQRKKELQG